MTEYPNYPLNVFRAAEEWSQTLALKKEARVVPFTDLQRR